tara:strand:+ start:862 stop:1305 length:444 start_codon:yes stop_codon:yes gene_type:complete
MELLNIQNNNKKNYYQNLLEITNKLDIDNNWIKKNINNFTEELTITESENVESSESKDVMFSEDYLYKKAWNKLSNVHKIIKLKEFVKKLPIKKDEDVKELIKTLNYLVKKKKLTRKDQVNYDSINGQVISIPNLQYKNGKYFVKNI